MHVQNWCQTAWRQLPAADSPEECAEQIRQHPGCTQGIGQITYNNDTGRCICDRLSDCALTDVYPTLGDRYSCPSPPTLSPTPAPTPSGPTPAPTQGTCRTPMADAWPACPANMVFKSNFNPDALNLYPDDIDAEAFNGPTRSTAGPPGCRPLCRHPEYGLCCEFYTNRGYRCGQMPPLSGAAPHEAQRSELKLCVCRRCLDRLRQPQVSSISGR